MTVANFLSVIQKELEKNATWEVYTAYDSTPFDKRPKRFLILEHVGETWGTPFQTDRYYRSRRLMLHLRVTAMIPQETDGETLVNNFFREVIVGLSRIGYSIHDLTLSAPAFLPQYRRMSMQADFNICCLYQEEREETT